MTPEAALPAWALAASDAASRGPASRSVLLRWFARSAPIPSRSIPLPRLEDLGSLFPPYCPILRRATPFLHPAQAAIADWPVSGDLVAHQVPGFLRPADALALFEIAWHARGDVLEMGSAWGLSSSILGGALAARGGRGKLRSIEIDPDFQRLTAATMRNAGLARRYAPLPGDALRIGEDLVAQGARFGAAFIDHDHRYPAVRAACRHVSRLLRPGGFVLVHDANDARNRTEPEAYGVHRAVCESVSEGEFTFAGIVGCCALLWRPSE